MKLYRNSFYILGLISCIALGTMIWLRSCQNLSIYYDICLGVFASALITTVSSLVCYFDKKKSIVSALALKSASLFGTLYNFGKMQPECLTTDKELQNLVHQCNMIADAIGQRDLVKELLQYVPFGKWGKSKQVYALWDVETNLVQGFPTLALLMKRTMCLYDKAVLCNDLAQARHYETEIKELYKQLNTLIANQKDFLDSILYVLYDSVFNKPWSFMRQGLCNATTPEQI